MKVYEVLIEDGRIVKGVNTTVDVGPNEIKTQAAKFGNSVDKDGHPPTLSSKVKGKSTNVLYNLGLAESTDNKRQQNYNEFAHFCAKSLDLKQLPKITLTGRDLEETFGYFDMDEQSITISFRNRHQMDVMRTLAHELVHYKQRQYREDLDGSDGSDDENEANAVAGIILRRWASRRPQLFSEAVEDQHPNERPLGPEIKPTMPKGTIRVGVSDVYDWYKLGKYIADLAGVDASQFGKGPPDTILSFGSEEEEHEYIKALKRLGLDITDIDPKYHDGKKGIATDPTYNVNETIRKVGSKYVVYSKKGKRMGSYSSRAAAKKRIQQIEYFKHAGE